MLKLQQAGEDPALEPVIANEQGSPCVDDEAGLLAREILPPDAAQDEPHADLGVLYAKTDATDDDPATADADELAAHAESGVAFALLTDGENTLIAQVVTAEADGRCVNGQPELSGRSAVVSLTILQPGEEPTVIALPPDNERFALPDTATDDPNDEMALHLNETIEEDTDNDGANDKVTQRAIWLEAEQGDIILGEAVADFSGNPCERAAQNAMVTVVKDTVPDDEQDFDFRIRAQGDPDEDGDDVDEEFQLDDDGDAENELPNSRTFEVPAGAVRVREAEEDGFETSVDCEPDQGETVDQDGRRVLFNAEPGEHVTCTFTNRPEDDEETGTVTVVKDTVPDDPQDFEFRLRSDDGNDEDGDDDFDEEFVLDDDGDAENEQPNSRTFEVPAGEVRIDEDEVDGFTTSVDCEPDQGEEVTQEGRRAAFQLEEDEDVTCTFTNAKDQPPDNGTVRVVKDTVPDDETVFDFRIQRNEGSENFDQEFTLQDDGVEDDGQPSTREFSVPPGEVRIEEDEVDGYNSSVDCEPDQGEEVDQEGRRVEFQLEAGETVTCTFTNAKVEDVPECRDGVDNDGDGKIDFPADPGCENPDDDDERDEVEPEPGEGTIEIRKAIVNTDPDGAGPFEFQGTDPIGEFSLAHNEEMEFNVPAGQYEVEELNDEDDGFRLWRIECDEEAGDETQGPAHGGDNTARIDLDSGEDITCSFYNARDDDPDPGNPGPGNANPDSGGSGGSGSSGSGSRSAALPLLDPVLTLLR